MPTTSGSGRRAVVQREVDTIFGFEKEDDALQLIKKRSQERLR
jgi:hypothetical protein